MSKAPVIFKNVAFGLLSATWHAVTKIVIPIFIFTSLIGIEVVGIDIGYTEERVATITYYILAFGYLSTALSFFKASSPKNSIRKPIAELIFEFVGICYLYTYRLSGALTFSNVSVPLENNISASFSLNLDVMIYVSMAVISLKMLIAVADIIKAIFFPSPKKYKKRSKKFEDQVDQFEEEIDDQ